MLNAQLISSITTKLRETPGYEDLQQLVEEFEDNEIQEVNFEYSKFF